MSTLRLHVNGSTFELPDGDADKMGDYLQRLWRSSGHAELTLANGNKLQMFVDKTTPYFLEVED